MLPARLRLSLLAVHAIAAATLVRSVLYDRWITVFAAVVMIVAAAAARRGRAWGLGLSFGTACAFPVAAMLGMGPPWFLLVGIVGALPFLMTARHFARRDAGAMAFGTVLAAMLGAFGAVGWRLAAPFVFDQFPSLQPSILPNNVLLAGLAAAVSVAIVSRERRALGAASGPATTAGVRVAVDSATVDAVDAGTVDDEVEAVAVDARRRHASG